MPALAGKVAFITGASSGRETCRILARECVFIIAAARNVNAAKETLSLIGGQNHVPLELDVSNQNSIKNALKVILDTYKKPPSIIVSSAGITKDQFLVKMPVADFDDGTFMVMQHFSKAIIQNGIQSASIINIASTSGKYGNIGQANYSASKAGVEGLTRTPEFGKFGIRVNCVLPGMIETPMAAAVPEKVREKSVKMVPLGRFGKPEEVGEVIAFLASDKSSYVNGATINRRT